MTPRLRANLYTSFNVAGTVLAATEAGFLATGRHPMALTVALAVYGVLSARVHSVARQYVSRPGAGAQGG